MRQLTLHSAAALAAILCVLTSMRDGHAETLHWTSNGPLAGVVAIAVVPSDSQVIYAGSTGTDGGKGVFKSSDGGRSWIAVNSGISNKRINAVAVDPRNPKIVYAGYEGAGFFKTTDGGDHWHTINRTPLHHGTSIAIDPLDSHVLYLGSDNGMFKGDDGGATTVPLKNGQPDAGTVVNIVIDPRDHRTLYISKYNESIDRSGIWKSTDAGQSWTAANSGLCRGPKLDLGMNRSVDSARLTFGLTLDPKHPDILYTGTLGGGVFKSIDGGRRWNHASDGINTGKSFGNNVYSVAVDPRDPNIVYAGTAGGGIFITSDGGTHWRNESQGLPPQNDRGQIVSVIWSITIAHDGKTIYAGNYGDGNGVYRATLP